MGRHKNTKKKTGRKKNKGLPDLESTSVPTQRKGGCVGPNILKYLMVPSVAGGLGYKPDPAMIWPETGWDDTDNESPFNKLGKSFLPSFPSFLHIHEVQSTLAISNSKGLSKILRDIRTSTYQICKIGEKNNSNNHI